MAGDNDNNNNDNNRGGGGGGNQNKGGGGGQAPKKPVTTRMQFANWISMSQIAVFSLNVLLNWVVLWYYTAPRPVVESVEDAAKAATVVTPGNTVWMQWWWLINIGLSVLAQIVLVYVPMFIDPAHRIYGSWRDNLQRLDTLINYIAFTILATQIMGVARGLSTFLGDLGSLLDQLIKAFGGILDLEVIVTLCVIYLLAAGVRHLGLITTLLPRTQKKG